MNNMEEAALEAVRKYTSLIAANLANFFLTIFLYLCYRHPIKEVSQSLRGLKQFLMRTQQ